MNLGIIPKKRRSFNPDEYEVRGKKKTEEGRCCGAYSPAM